MAEFSIAFDGKTTSEEGITYEHLTLNLFGVKEGEACDVTTWSKISYENHWRRELNAVLNQKKKGALIVSMHDPRIGYRIMAWPMWRNDQTVHFQNRLLFMLNVQLHFNPEDIADYIGEHEKLDEDGEQISDWVVPADAIQTFLSATGATDNR